MCCPANERIEVVVCDAEVNINSVQHILRQVFKDVLSHFNVDVSFRLVSRRTVTNLNSSRVKWSVGVLVTGNQNYVFKPVKAFHFANLVKTARLHIVVDCIRHA